VETRPLTAWNSGCFSPALVPILLRATVSGSGHRSVSINPAPWWPLIGTPAFSPPPPSSLGTYFSPVHLLLNLCSPHPHHHWEPVAVTQIYPLNQGNSHPLAWSTVLRLSQLSPPAPGCVVGGGSGCGAEHWAWGWVRVLVQRGREAPGGFSGGYLLGWLGIGGTWWLLFPPLPVAETTGLGTFNPPGAGPRDEPCTWMTRVGAWLQDTAWPGLLSCPGFAAFPSPSTVLGMNPGGV